MFFFIMIHVREDYFMSTNIGPTSTTTSNTSEGITNSTTRATSSRQYIDHWASTYYINNHYKMLIANARVSLNIPNIFDAVRPFGARDLRDGSNPNEA